MTDYAEVIEICKIAQQQGGPQSLSAVGIGRYLRVCSPELVLGLLSDIEKLAAQVRLAGASAEATAHQAVGRATSDYLVVMFERDRLMAEVESLRKEVERLQREERNDAIAYKAVIERQKELRVERDQIRAEANDLRKDAGRWQFIRDVWPKVKLVPNGEWFNSCFLEREIDAAMSKETGQ